MNTVRPLESTWLLPLHASGHTYDAYLAQDPVRAPQWHEIHERVTLAEKHHELLQGFSREMKVFCLSGTWCGDCVQQGPMIEKIAQASPMINLRWFDRDEFSELAEAVKINGGLRVPTVIFCAEDYEPVMVYGDRSLTRYRAAAARNLGPSCPLPGAPLPQDELEGTLQDWVDEFERVHLLLRLSARLREKHQD